MLLARLSHDRPYQEVSSDAWPHVRIHLILNLNSVMIFKYLLRSKILIHAFLYVPAADRNWERLLRIFDSWGRGWLSENTYPSVRLFHAQCEFYLDK